MKRLLCLLLVVAAALVAREPVRSRHAMVAAQEENAARAGLDVIRQGGNAIDAAVATAFALAVTLPSAGNLGGGGFLLVRFATGNVAFVDFRERAPQAASRNMYLDESGQPAHSSTAGWRAAGVPGTVRGLEYAHSKWGSRPWSSLVEPAVQLARDGFTVSFELARSLEGSANLLRQFPESRRIFLNDGAGWQFGDRLRQPELAATLARIARAGARDFYEGETARILAAQSQARGGLITLADLKSYQATAREPLTGSYKGITIISAPPPSSGGLGLLQMTAMLNGTGYEHHGAGSAAALHIQAEVMRRFYADRARYIADPDFFRVPVAGLLDPAYIARRRASIDPDRASASRDVGAGEPAAAESAATTHFSIVDAQGNAVALTYTINGSYGNGVTVPELGFLLNNEMDDFSVRPGLPNMFGLIQGEGNAIEPRKRPLSAMTPTILARDGKTYMVIGAPGGPRIINGVLQAMLNVIDFKMNMQDAIDAPRIHHQWQPDQLVLERGFSPDTITLLKQRGHTIGSIGNVALVSSILIDSGYLQGAVDGRAGGLAVGY